MEPLAYLNDPAVLRMGTLARGVYSTLLLALWSMPEPGVVEADDAILAMLARATAAEWEETKEAVARAFDTDSRPGFWVQKRMAEVHRTQSQWVARQASSGRAGGKARAAKLIARVATSNVQGSVHSPSKAASSGLVCKGFGSGLEKQKDLSARADALPFNTETEIVPFAEFYAAYPRKEKRLVAERAWARLGAKDRRAAMEGLARFKATVWAGVAREFIPHPASWVNARRWEDEIAPATSAPISPGDELKRAREAEGKRLAEEQRVRLAAAATGGRDG